MMATKADSHIPGNPVDTWANKAAQMMRAGMRGFSSGPEATMPHQQAGYMCLCYQRQFNMKAEESE